MTSLRFKRVVAAVALPYFRLELPGWRRVASHAGLPVSNVAQWAQVPPRTIRGKTHRLLMTLVMQDWCERLTYFLGRYYEFALERLLQRLLRPGDTFIDVGGNIGMMTLTGASCVGPEGRVYAFEPQPLMAERIRHAIGLNGLANVTVFQCGLADSCAALPLTVVAEANGWSTFGSVEDRDPSLTYSTITVSVAKGDDLLPSDIRGAITIKIDVEGFECRVLRGLAGVVERTRPAVITEVEPHLLRAAGSSVDEVFALMHGRGYEGYTCELVRRFFVESIVLTRVFEPGAVKTGNILWLHPDGAHVPRVAGVIRPLKMRDNTSGHSQQRR
jgi:FkbM family methyltransferase